MNLRTTVAFVTVCVASAALALQLVLIVERMTSEGATVAGAVWRYLGFFTILANMAVAFVAGAMTLRPHSAVAGQRVRLATATAIVVVGIVYSVALRHIWEPTGWQAVADHALHDATPPLFALAWALSDHGILRWRDALWAIAAPLGYCVYAFARGAADGWYAYWFLDPNALSLRQIAASVALLLTVFLVVALALIKVDRWLATRRQAE